MKNNSIFVVVVMSILLSACGSTNGNRADRNALNGIAAGTRHISEGAGDWTDTPSNTNPSVLDGSVSPDLPRFGAEVDPDYPAKSSLFVPLAAMYEGILSIKGGCVTVTVEPWQPSTKYRVILPIFPPNSHFIEGSQSIKVNGVILSDGDKIAMNASTTTRDFWANMKPDKPYNPVPAHCQASEYWEINGEGMWLVP